MSSSFRPGAPDANPARDAEHLKLLGIFHYVYAGIQVFVGLLLLIYVAMGLAVVRGMFPWSSGSSAAHPSAVPPAWIGWVFIVFGAVFCAWFQTMAVMNVLSARFLGRRRHRVFLLVIAALDCLWVPFGTVLGVFDFLVLSRDSVRRLFQADAS